MEEEWRDVVGFEDLFMVSDRGRVFSKRTNKMLVPTKTKSGYLTICTKIGGRNGKNVTKRIHRWVAEAFIENPENKEFVNHINADKTNNKKENLEWCTSQENTKHAFETGLMKIRKGEGCYQSKLSEESVSYIRSHYIPYSRQYGAQELSRVFGVDKSTILKVIKNETWKASALPG